METRAGGGKAHAPGREDDSQETQDEEQVIQPPGEGGGQRMNRKLDEQLFGEWWCANVLDYVRASKSREKKKEVNDMPDRYGTGPRSRSPRPKGKKQGRKLGNC